jgi:hypothetical protein
MACCKKPGAKKVVVKDVASKKNPRGGMNKSERPALAAPRIATTMQDTVNAKLNG